MSATIKPMTTHHRSIRPGPDEYPPYFTEYISRVPDGDVIDTLARQISETVALLRGLPESMGDRRYAPGKWSILEVVGHMADAERVFTYRALRFSRRDPTPVEGFDENDYVRNAPFSRMTLADLTSEFEHLRRSSIYMFNGLDEEAMARRGIANGLEVSVRALAFIAAGHENHHIDILRTRYL